MKCSDGTSVVVLDADKQRILLHQRRDFRVWSLPGGAIEPGESWKDAGIREVFEETGYEIEVERRVGEYKRPNFDGGVKYVCVGRTVAGAAIQGNDETRQVKWFPLNRLPFSLPSFMREYIQDALRDHNDVLKKTQRIHPGSALLFRLLIWLRDCRRTSG